MLNLGLDFSDNKENMEKLPSALARGIESCIVAEDATRSCMYFRHAFGMQLISLFTLECTYVCNVYA